MRVINKKTPSRIRQHLNQMDAVLNQDTYQTIRWQAKQIAHSMFNDLSEAQRILLIFPEPRELITATYACLEKGHSGIAYRFKSAQTERLINDIKTHQIQKIWCAPSLKQEIQHLLATPQLTQLLL